jgi:enamine deaminase RidA (YjgF/YER057c/UK114 family)
MYGGHSKTDPPVRTIVEVARLPFDVMLEVDVIAYTAYE